jgi:DNA polymerase-1
MMGMRLKLNPQNYQLLKDLCYEEATKSHTKVVAQVGREINVGSSQQVGKLLYDELKLPRKRNRKTGKDTTDENALRELRVGVPKYKELLNAIIEEKHIRKRIESYIEIETDEDDYIPYAANPAGTETNRWSFSKSPRGRGLNAQTLPKVMRIMCDAPTGWIFICPDLPQADARIVAWDAKCESLIKLFLDPTVHYHLENCIRLFGIPREEAYAPKFKAEDPRYTTGKAMGHAANYRMAPKRLAMELGIPIKEAETLLGIYLHRLYPEIERWQLGRKELIKRFGGLRTPKPFERFRTFHKAWAELLLTGKISHGSINEACAYVPQSVVADIVNVGMEKLWEGFPDARLHLHGHDSYLASVPSSKLGDACRFALDALKVTLVIHDRPLTMVPDMQVGYNYGLMVPWKGEDQIIYEDWEAKVAGKLDPEKLRKDLYGYY